MCAVQTCDKIALLFYFKFVGFGGRTLYGFNWILHIHIVVISFGDNFLLHSDRMNGHGVRIIETERVLLKIVSNY